MTSNVFQNICYIIIFTFCIDEGDGRWRYKDRENIKHDIELYRLMAEKIEREIEAFYNEYPEERLGGDSVDMTHYKYGTNTFKLSSEEDVFSKSGEKQNFTYNASNNTNNINSTQRKLDTKWPTFDEILLEIGKKYDWKNDRWIKVKEKFAKSKNVPTTTVTKLSDDSKAKFHELEKKFRYKIVKLNRSKNRRSVVVAVTAIR